MKNEAILRDCETSSTFELDNVKKETILQLATSKTKQFCKASSIFEGDNMKNEAILRDCETSSTFELDNVKKENSAVGNVKNEAILRDFLRRAYGLVPMRFAIFPVHVSKILRLPRKSDARSYKVLHLSRKITLMLQNATPLRKSAP